MNGIKIAIEVMIILTARALYLTVSSGDAAATLMWNILGCFVVTLLTVGGGVVLLYGVFKVFTKGQNNEDERI